MGIQVVSRNPLPSSASTTRKFPPRSSLAFNHCSPATSTAPNPLRFHFSITRHASASTIFCSRLHHLFPQLLFSHRVLSEFLLPASKSLPTLAQPPVSKPGPITTPGSHVGRSHTLVCGTGTFRSG